MVVFCRRFETTSLNLLITKDGTDRFPETSAIITNLHHVTPQKNADLIYSAMET